MTSALSFHSNYMEDDKANAGRKKLALYLGIGIFVVLGLVLLSVELWSHSHKSLDFQNLKK